ncbi:hypothetical protein GSF24_35435, partial [Microbispora triticiradicis]|nr:hypothetical protein [Microbispora triticiradicis]
MGRTAGLRMAVAAVSACAALSAAFPGQARAERHSLAAAVAAAAGRPETGGAVRAAEITVSAVDPGIAPGVVGGAAGASRTAADPHRPGVRIGLCVDVDVIVGLHAEVGVGGPASCTPPTPVPPPPSAPQPAPP